jgi:hypothetical protein
MAAIDDLNELLQGLPGYALLTDNMKQAALAGSLIPDSNGVWPGQPGYQPTYDIYFAAVNLCTFLQAQPVIRSSSSEGSSVSVDAPNWDALLNYYRSQSPICAATGSTILQKISIPDGPHVVHVPMEVPSEVYGDVDTDVS